MQPLLRLVALSVGWSLTLSVSTYCLFGSKVLGYTQPQLSATFSLGAAITVLTQVSNTSSRIVNRELRPAPHGPYGRRTPPGYEQAMRTAAHTHTRRALPPPQPPSPARPPSQTPLIYSSWSTPVKVLTPSSGASGGGSSAVASSLNTRK